MGFQPYHSPSTGCEVGAVLFDTFGTVVDWRTGIARQAAAFAAAHGQDLDAETFADDWRALYQPAMEAIRSGSREFATLDTLHRENLDHVLRRHGFTPDRLDLRALEELNKSWHRLPPWPDSVEGLAAIRRRYIVGPLSNGNTSLLLNMARNAGLPWDVIIGSDLTRTYKPLPRAYLRTAEVLGSPARRSDACRRPQRRPACCPGGGIGDGVRRTPHRIWPWPGSRPGTGERLGPFRIKHHRTFPRARGASNSPVTLLTCPLLQLLRRQP